MPRTKKRAAYSPSPSLPKGGTGWVHPHDSRHPEQNDNLPAPSRHSAAKTDRAGFIHITPSPSRGEARRGCNLPLTLDITVRDKRFYFKIPFLKSFCRRVIETTWDSNPRPAQLSLTLADDVFIQKLNKKYRGKNKPTNVLSFESRAPRLENTPWPAGDIVLAYETILTESRSQGIPFRAHFTHLLIHGTLHLLGWDHLKNRDAAQMEKLETTLMKKLGFQDPYKD